MPKPRKTLVSLEATPYYHCVSRCVRRAFLCGEDSVTGMDYEHRRGWIEDKLLSLTQFFAIDIAAYAIMSNHYHVVLHVDQPRAKGWSREVVLEHWHGLFSGHELSRRYLKGETLTKAELNALEELVKLWRTRLMDISWFMRCLNEAIARMANEEDDCTGRFWEGRFKSQALLDEAALLSCMAYVDLNPIRAKMAKTPEDSSYTAIRRRIHQAEKAHTPNHPQQQVKSLMPFVGGPRQNMPDGLPFRLSDYLELVDWSGRSLRENKRGAINEKLPPILQRLHMTHEQWQVLTQHFEDNSKAFMGSADKVKIVCAQLGYQRTPGMSVCQARFP